MKESIDQKIKESDDEKIRKHLIVLFKREFGENSNVRFAGIKVKDIIAWLEKQGEQKPIKEHNVCEFCEDRYGCVNPCPTKLIEGQKPDWSEEDKKCLENAIMYCEWARDKAPDLHCYETSEKSINFLKSLRLNNTWKPSDKQIEALDFAADCIVPDEFCFKRNELKGLLEQLKKLREE